SALAMLLEMVFRRVLWALMPLPAILKTLVSDMGMLLLFAAQSAYEPFELAIEQGKARLEVNGVLDVTDLLDLHINGVLIKRGVVRRTETQRRIGDFHSFSSNVFFIGEIDATKAALLTFGSLSGKDAAELEIPRLVVGGVGVGNIVGKHFGTLSAKTQRLLVNPQRLVETDAHDLAL